MIVARYEVPGIPSHRGPSHRARYELYHNARSTRKTLLADPIIPFPTGRVLRFTGFQALRTWLLSFSPSGTKPPLTSHLSQITSPVPALRIRISHQTALHRLTS